METQFVSADELETLEHYACALVTGMLSIRTLETFHNQAVKKGILDTDELELAKTIAWELVRLMKLYQQQTSHVMERANIDASALIDSFQKLSLDKAKQMVKQNKKVK